MLIKYSEYINGLICVTYSRVGVPNKSLNSSKFLKLLWTQVDALILPVKLQYNVKLYKENQHIIDGINDTERTSEFSA